MGTVYAALGNGAIAPNLSRELSSFARGARVLLGYAVVSRDVNVPSDIRVYGLSYSRDLHIHPAYFNIEPEVFREGHMEAMEAAHNPLPAGRGSDVIFLGSLISEPGLFYS